jgi:hypothetical protein
MPLLPGLRHARKPKTEDYKGYTLTLRANGNYDITLGKKPKGYNVPPRKIPSRISVLLSSGTKSLVSEELTRMASLA